MDFQVINTYVEKGILIITINRPKSLNALNKMVFNELEYCFSEYLATLNSIKGIIITGSGDKAFVAGADISEFLNLKGLEAKNMGWKGLKIFEKIENSIIPVIAAVNGFALGGGLELAMACHLRIVTDNAKFGLPETSLGIIPGYGGTQRLVQLIGRGRALHMMMTAEMIDATTALQYGLANKVVTLGDELNVAKDTLLTIAQKGPLAISAVIDSVNAYFDPIRNGYEAENFHFGQLGRTEDFKEGTTAFLKKRKPIFKGK